MSWRVSYNLSHNYTHKNGISCERDFYPPRAEACTQGEARFGCTRSRDPLSTSLRQAAPAGKNIFWCRSRGGASPTDNYLPVHWMFPSAPLQGAPVQVLQSTHCLRSIRRGSVLPPSGGRITACKSCASKFVVWVSRWGRGGDIPAAATTGGGACCGRLHPPSCRHGPECRPTSLLRSGSGLLVAMVVVVVVVVAWTLVQWS